MSGATNTEKYVAELIKALDDSVHKRLIAAYKGADPKQSMEEELGRILVEVMGRED